RDRDLEARAAPLAHHDVWRLRRRAIRPLHGDGRAVSPRVRARVHGAQRRSLCAAIHAHRLVPQRTLARSAERAPLPTPVPPPTAAVTRCAATTASSGEYSTSARGPSPWLSGSETNLQTGG